MPKATPPLTAKELAIVAKHGPLVRRHDAMKRRALVNSRYAHMIKDWAGNGGRTNALKLKAAKMLAKQDWKQ